MEKNVVFRFISDHQILIIQPYIIVIKAIFDLTLNESV
jgi:hypothetical protein